MDVWRKHGPNVVLHLPDVVFVMGVQRKHGPNVVFHLPDVIFMMGVWRKHGPNVVFLLVPLWKGPGQAAEIKGSAQPSFRLKYGLFKKVL